MFRLSSYLWTPQRRGLEQAIATLELGSDLCLYGPTGSGKTVQAEELARWAWTKGVSTCFYVNRRLLIAQTLKRFRAGGLDVGVRAAGYEDEFDPARPVQICSADTERARCFDSKARPAKWYFHEAGLIIVDEAHIQKADTMQQILDVHRSKGAQIVLLTATPIGISHMVDNLVVSGTMNDYRECGALVMAEVKGIEQPDMRKVKRNKTGEYIFQGRKKEIYTQHIVGSAFDNWKQWNPDARAALAYWPGKPESVWGTKVFTDAGVPWCHVDATDAVIPEWQTVEGRRTLVTRRVQLSRAVWEEILGRFKDGEIKGLSSRFKLREGVDVPFVYHQILATPIGSLSSYVQTVGRVLRKSPETPDGVLITDHGGNYLRHGSPNASRPWERWWNMKEAYIIAERERGMREHNAPEPIVCPIPTCRGERTGGIKCPHCGYVCDKSRREVIQEDGSLKTIEGRLMKPPKVKLKTDTAEKWARIFWGCRKHKRNRTFAQLEGWFAHENGYHPPRDIPFMPKAAHVWSQIVHKINMADLT